MIIPTSGRLVLQKIKEEEKPKGSLILPSSQPKQERYEIVTDSTLKYGPGIIVYIDKYKGTEIVKDNVTYLVVNDDDIVGYEA